MNVLIYVNKAKDPNGLWLNECVKFLDKENISHKLINDENLSNNESADAMFVLGGDGTILNLTEFACKNSIPVIGINAGKLGFLTEFELCEMEQAISLLKKGELISDLRQTMVCKVGNDCYYTLNDAVLQRIKVEQRGNNVASVNVELDNISVEKIVGDGVCVSTPTGSTAYSLSAGGAILSPGIKTFSITPIAAHSLNQRAIVYSSSSTCKITVTGNCAVGLFIDGIFARELFLNEVVIIENSSYPVTFLRKKDFNFYKRLSDKLKDRQVK